MSCLNAGRDGRPPHQKVTMGRCASPVLLKGECVLTKSLSRAATSKHEAPSVAILAQVFLHVFTLGVFSACSFVLECSAVSLAVCSRRAAPWQAVSMVVQVPCPWPAWLFLDLRQVCSHGQRHLSHLPAWRTPRANTAIPMNPQSGVVGGVPMVSEVLAGTGRGCGAGRSYGELSCERWNVQMMCPSRETHTGQFQFLICRRRSSRGLFHERSLRLWKCPWRIPLFRPLSASWRCQNCTSWRGRSKLRT